MASPALAAVAIAFISYAAFSISKVIHNLYFHPLRRFPGPRFAAASKWWKTNLEVFQQKSMCHELIELHSPVAKEGSLTALRIGDIVRIGPNELHFSTPQAFNDIYNNRNRWSKESSLYDSLGGDQSSFGYLHYREAKERKDVLNRVFSAQAIEQTQVLVQEKVNHLCTALARQTAAGKPSDLYFAFRCSAMDVITHLCFGKDIHAVDAPDFKAPLVEALHHSTPAFTVFRHFSLLRKITFNMPSKMSIAMNPDTKGLILMLQHLNQSIAEHVKNPHSLDHLTHTKTIYHLLLDSKEQKEPQYTKVSPKSLFHESQALMFGGGDTTANVIMDAVFHVSKHPEILGKLKAELEQAWPALDTEPTLKDLEKLRYLTAVIQEALRVSPGVPSGLPRVVPAGGAQIDGRHIPEGTIVSMSTYFIHQNPALFVSPETFDPSRWLGPASVELKKWLVAFSRGPRSCLGVNLAWAELRFNVAYVIRKFDIELADDSPKTESLPWREVFLPFFYGPHLKAYMKPVLA